MRVRADVKLEPQATPDFHKDANGDYVFSLEMVEVPGPNGTLKVNRTVTLVLKYEKRANQSEAATACKSTGSTLFVSLDIADLRQLDGVVSAALREEKCFDTFSGWVKLGGHRNTLGVWMAPAISSHGTTLGRPGMNISIDGANGAPLGIDGDCLHLINWSNLQYSGLFYWAGCDKGSYACVKSTVV